MQAYSGTDTVPEGATALLGSLDSIRAGRKTYWQNAVIFGVSK